MSSNVKTAVCQNLDCGKSYTATKNDDGFCSFECWETVNCKTPQKKVELFDMSELLVSVKRA